MAVSLMERLKSHEAATVTLRSQYRMNRFLNTAFYELFLLFFFKLDVLVQLSASAVGCFMRGRWYVQMSRLPIPVCLCLGRT